MWHYVSGGQAVGPVDNARMSALIASGEVRRETKVWRQGMSDWAPAGQTELSEQFDAAEAGHTPPPMPAALPAEYAGFPCRIDGLRKWVRGSITVYLAFSLAALFAQLARISFLGNLQADAAEKADENLQNFLRLDAIIALIDFAILLVFIFTGIVVLRWTFRAMKNVLAAGVDTGISPTMSVIWYFIPIASLWMPLLTMRRIWRGSFNPRNPDGQPVPATMGWWWALYIGGGILAMVAELIQAGAGVWDLPLEFDWTDFEQIVDLEAYMHSQILNVVYLVMDITAGILLIRLVRQISRAQDENLVSSRRV